MHRNLEPLYPLIIILWPVRRSHHSTPFVTPLSAKGIAPSTCAVNSEWLVGPISTVMTVDVQGGKGRTGLFVSSLLLWVGFKPTYGECLDVFSSRRTDISISSQHQGVRAPSQLRYMQYISSALSKKNFDYRSPDALILRNILVSTVPFAKQILLARGQCLACLDLQHVPALLTLSSRHFLTSQLCSPLFLVNF
jgi:hypothetical protein